MSRQLFRTAIITDEFRQDPDVDPLTPESVAGWLVIDSENSSEDPDWQIFENFEHAQERAWELMQIWSEEATTWKVYPLYAGEPITVTKPERVVMVGERMK